MDNKLIEPMSLEEIQQALLTILLKIKEICDENGLRFYLAYGTLLGAYRHKGFIPWDDDIDIHMPRPDYEKFIDYCVEHKDELGSFEIMHYKTNRKYIYPFAKFSDSRYVFDCPKETDYGLGLFVDIFPLDGNTDKVFRLWKLRKLYIRMIYVASNRSVQKSDNIIKTVLFKYPVYLLCKAIGSRRLIMLSDRFSRRYSFDDATYVTSTCWDNRRFEKKDFETPCYLDYCGEAMPAPNPPEKALTEVFGSDYMTPPPPEKRQAHHLYRAYRKQG
ncbi:MAG: LicD family protein [Eubacterium sp.]|nr:LicD family protein [Eubacterium sp.]